MATASHRERLESLRDKLEAALDVASENMLPQLAGQYRATLEALAQLDASQPVAGIEDDLKRKRAERRKEQRARRSG